MTESPSSNQRKRRSTNAGWSARIELLISVGLAKVITGSFGVGSDHLKGRQRAGELRCSIAQQIVLDDAFNGALNGMQRTRLNALALQGIEQCLGETP
jgi:hypothetical protein